jgi:YhcH/YjgK/YiaL family protein
MIFDQLKNAHLYFPLGERVQRALEYLINTDFTGIEPGKYEIDGDNIYAVISQYDTKPITAGKWEAHKQYLDIQAVLEGKEKIGYSFSSKMIITQPYNEYKDIMFLKGEGSFLTAEAGYFMILFPSDIHMPGIAMNISTSVKKVVLKVKVDLPVEPADTNPVDETPPNNE